MRKGGVDVGINRTTVSAHGRTMLGHWELAGPNGTSFTHQPTLTTCSLWQKREKTAC